MIKKIKELYLKYKEIINYLIAGFLTTVVSIASYEIYKNIFNINYIISNVLSWITAVIFAYFVNRKYVFESKTQSKEKILEFFNFIKYRILTLVIETLSMYIMVDKIGIDDDIAKIVVQVIVIVLNYVFSKFFTFNKKKNKE